MRFFTFVGDPVLTASPADSIVNETITLRCQFENEVNGADFYFPYSVICRLDCQKIPLCAINCTCFENKVFEIEVSANASWNNKTLQCSAPFGGIRSKNLTITVKGRIIYGGTSSFNCLEKNQLRKFTNN